MDTTLKILALLKQERLIVGLFGYEGLTPKEISAVMNLKESKVHSVLEKHAKLLKQAGFR